MVVPAAPSHLVFSLCMAPGHQGLSLSVVSRASKGRQWRQWRKNYSWILWKW